MLIRERHSRRTILINRISLVAIFASVVSAFPIYLLSALSLRLQQTIGFSITDFGLVVSVYYLSAALSSIPSSRIATRLGSFLAVRLGPLLGGACLVVIAAQSHLFGLILASVLSGAVSSFIQPSTNAFLSEFLPARRLAFVFGLKQAAVPLAVFFSGLTVPFAVSFVGWRPVFMSCGVIVIAISLRLRRFAQLRGSDRSVRTTSRFRRSEVAVLCAIAVVFFLGVSGASSLSSFTVLAGHDIGLPESASGLLTAGGGLIAAFMRVAAGKMAEKEDADPLRMTLFMLLGGALGYLTLFSVSQSKLLFCTGVVLAFAFGWGWNGLLNLAVVSQFYKRAANATGVSAVGARLGGVCGPFIFGLLTDRYSYQTSWLFPFGCCLIGAVVLMFVGQRRYS